MEMFKTILIYSAVATGIILVAVDLCRCSDKERGVEPEFVRGDSPLWRQFLEGLWCMVRAVPFIVLSGSIWVSQIMLLPFVLLWAAARSGYRLSRRVVDWLSSTRRDENAA